MLHNNNSSTTPLCLFSMAWCRLVRSLSSFAFKAAFLLISNSTAASNPSYDAWINGVQPSRPRASIPVLFPSSKPAKLGTSPSTTAFHSGLQLSDIEGEIERRCRWKGFLYAFEVFFTAVHSSDFNNPLSSNRQAIASNLPILLAASSVRGEEMHTSLHAA